MVPNPNQQTRSVVSHAIGTIFVGPDLDAHRLRAERNEPEGEHPNAMRAGRPSFRKARRLAGCERDKRRRYVAQQGGRLHMLPDFARTRGEMRGDMHNHWPRSGRAPTAPQGSDTRSHRQFPANLSRSRGQGAAGSFGSTRSVAKIAATSYTRPLETLVYPRSEQLASDIALDAQMRVPLRTACGSSLAPRGLAGSGSLPGTLRALRPSCRAPRRSCR